MTQFRFYARYRTLDQIEGTVFKLAVLCVIFLLCFGPTLLSKRSNVIENGSIFFIPDDPKFVVATSRCKIPDLNPFGPELLEFYKPQKYLSCNKNALLTYVTKVDNIATLHIDTKTIRSYTKNNISCCYANITRRESKNNPDDSIKISSCVTFQHNITIVTSVIVKCKDSKSRKQIYENVHAPVIADKSVKRKMEAFRNTNLNPFSVAIVGIDSISRVHLMGSLPKTHKFLVENDWIPLKGYNKIGDNTFPNVMAILSGLNQTYTFATYNPKKLNGLDRCPMIWSDFRKLNYITAFAEDAASISTFNYLKKGFTEPPTDYYFRPYVLGFEKLKKVSLDGRAFCTGPEASGERIMNLAKDFHFTFKDYPTFSFFWMNSFSHESWNTPTRMDGKIKSFLEEMSSSGVLNNTFVIFLSDHGRRFGDVRRTSIGWLEERLPFIYLSIPERFKKQFPTEYKNLLDKRNQLTNPYDLYMTLQHILLLSGFRYTMLSSRGCPKCKSLFMETERDRSCEDAAIEQHWCTCTGYSPIDLNDTKVKKAANFIMDQIQEIIHNKNSDYICAKYDVKRIIGSSISEAFKYKNETYILVLIETQPTAHFEATVLYKNDIKEEFMLQGEISRLDIYESHSRCAMDGYLKKYCYCR